MKILTLSQNPNFMLFGFYAFMPDTSAWEWKAITFTSFLEACAKAREINYAECVCLGKSFRDPMLKEAKSHRKWLETLHSCRGRNKLEISLQHLHHICRWQHCQLQARWPLRFQLMQEREIQPNIFTYTSLAAWLQVLDVSEQLPNKKILPILDARTDFRASRIAWEGVRG